MHYKIEIKGTEKHCLQAQEILSKNGFQTVVQKIRAESADSIECELIDMYLKDGLTHKWTANQIKSYLEEKAGVQLSINFVGSALKKMGYEKRTIKISQKIYTKGYTFALKESEAERSYPEEIDLGPAEEVVKIDEERMARFKKAKETGLIKLGIKASDYDNPDDFNEAVYQQEILIKEQRICGGS